MRSLVLSVLMAVAAISMQGCDLLHDIVNTVFLMVECTDEVLHASIEAKEKALDEIPKVCKDSATCVDEGTLCIETYYNGTVFAWAAQCFEHVGNSTDLTVEPNISSSVVPGEVDKWGASVKAELQKNFTGTLDQILDSFRSDQAATCAGFSAEGKFSLQALAYVKSPPGAGRPFPAAGAALCAAVALLSAAALFSCRRAARKRAAAGGAEPDMELLLE